MNIYITMLIVSIFFCFLSTLFKNNALKKLFAFLSFLPIFIISSIRYDVGTDYLYRYASSFEYIKNGFKILNLEPGYVMLNKLILLFTNNYIWVFIITSFIIISLIFRIIYKKSPMPVLSILLFFLGGYFFQSLNMVRQYISIAIVMNAYPYLLKKQYFKYILSVAIASMFHGSAWFYLILLFWNKFYLFKPKYVLAISTVIIFLKSFLLVFITTLLSSTKFSVYFSTDFNISQLRITLLLSNIVIYFIMYYLFLKRKEKEILTDEHILFLNMQTIGLLFCISGIITYLSFRIAILFFAFQIISIPILMYDLNSNLKKNITIILLLFLSICIFHTNIQNNDEGVLPYKSIFDYKNEGGLL